MAPIVIVSERLGAITDEERRISASGAELRQAALWSHQEIRANAAGAHVVLLGAVEPFDAEALASLPDCRAVVRRGVGVDNVDADAATRLGIVVANVPDASIEEVSDHALALLLALERRVVRLDAAVRGGAWQSDARLVQAARGRSRRLAQLTLGIVGLGRIGQALARKARPIYDRIVAADPIVAPAVAEAIGVELLDVPSLLAAADHVSLHVPLGPGTRHLIDAAAISAMRPGAVLVNTARGGLVDEAAVLEAVAGGRLGGAGLDVTEREPLPQDDPLVSAADIVLTGHSAMWSTTASEELARRSVDAVLDLLAGRRPASIVNPAVLASPALRIPELLAASTAGAR